MPKKKKQPEQPEQSQEDVVLLEEAKRIMGPTQDEMKTSKEMELEAQKKEAIHEEVTKLEKLSLSEIEHLKRATPPIPEVAPGVAADFSSFANEASEDVVLDPSKTIDELTVAGAEVADTTSTTVQQGAVIDAFSNDPGLTTVVKEIGGTPAETFLDAAENKPVKQVVPREENKLKEWFLHFWHQKRKRNATLGVIVILLIIIFTVPVSRYFAMNTVGVRVSAKITVVDDRSNQPLPNVEVTVGEKVSKTGSDGIVVLDGLKQGSQKVVLSKRSFAEAEQQVTLGLGSNPLEIIRMTPKGETYTFVLIDWLSKEPIRGAEVTDGESRAFADELGNVALTIEPNSTEELQLTAKATGYRDELITVNVEQLDGGEIALVVGSPLVFLSTRDSTRDIYKIDADGKNEELLLKGTGNERANLQLITTQDGQTSALAASRDDTFNTDGYRLDGLHIIQTGTKEVKKIDTGEQIELLGFSGEYLVFVKIMSGASASNPERHRLMTYRLGDGETKQLAASNYFTEARLVNGVIYFSTSNTGSAANSAAFKSVNVDGSEEKTILGSEIWTVYWNEFNQISIQAPGNIWWKYTVGDSSSVPVGTQSEPENKNYLVNKNGKVAAWSEGRDGKIVIVLYDIEKKSDTIITPVSAAQAYPLRWLSDTHMIYRVSGAESADYVINIDGGEASKVVNITPTNNNRWIR